jgi:subfamily B ATP-binding cassette protein HlyB/CyaB
VVNRDAGLMALAVVARLHGKALDPEQVRHELAIEGAARADDLLHAARRNGFKAVLDTLDLRCMCAPLPCIVELKDGAGFVVLAKTEGGRALIHEDDRTQTIELVALQARLSGRALLVASRARSEVIDLLLEPIRWMRAEAA